MSKVASTGCTIIIFLDTPLCLLEEFCIGVAGGLIFRQHAAQRLAGFSLPNLRELPIREADLSHDAAGKITYR